MLLAPLSVSAGDDGATVDRAARKARRQAEREARQREREPLKQAKAFRKLELSEGLDERVERLTTELTWHESLEAAQVEAKKENKPILWVQALGELRGML